MAIGTVLTIAGTLLQIPIYLPEWLLPLANGVWPGLEFSTTEPTYVLSFQLAGWMIVAGVAGARAACWSQIFYLLTGLLGWSVFTNDSGWQAMQQPTFGYLLGFVPGAWVCGRVLARESQPSPRWIAASCLVGLSVVHAVGLTYLLVQSLLNRGGDEFALGLIARQASLELLVGQVLLVPVVVLITLIARRILLLNDKLTDSALEPRNAEPSDTERNNTAQYDTTRNS